MFEEEIRTIPQQRFKHIVAINSNLKITEIKNLLILLYFHFWTFSLHNDQNELIGLNGYIFGYMGLLMRWIMMNVSSYLFEFVPQCYKTQRTTGEQAVKYLYILITSPKWSLFDVPIVFLSPVMYWMKTNRWFECRWVKFSKYGIYHSGHKRKPREAFVEVNILSQYISIYFHKRYTVLGSLYF